ncbi:MAG: protein kinase domain-containing protein [Anaerolineae bacterium]
METNRSLRRIGNRYLLLNKLGEGGMGVVYHAKDRLTGREVALKRVLTNLEILSLDDTLQADNFRLALAREFKLSASLRHPNIVDVLDYGFDGDQQPYFTMELLDKPKNIVQSARTLDVPQRLDLILQLLHALNYLHRRGIVHRDLKPANVMMIAGRVKVLDFGLSIMHERPNTDDMADSTVGTLAYMSPEVLQGVRGGIQADLYAVGMLAYEMLAGQHPYDINDPTNLINQILIEMPPIDELDVPLDVAMVIIQLLQKDPADRYQSASEAIDALQATTDNLAITDNIAIRDSFLQAARFVGRDRELAQLNQALHRAVYSKSSAWLIGGESGVGKSRIIDEVRTQALVNGAIVMRGQAVDVGSRPYEIWLTALRWLCLLDDYLTDTDVALLKSFVSDAHEMISRDVTALAPLNLPPDELQIQMLQLFARVLRAFNHPVMMLFEDIHWAGSESIQALAQWSAMLEADLPIIVIASYRDDEKPALHQQFSHMQLMKLKRLDNQEIAELSAAMLGESGRTTQVVDLLRRETEGNVFFVVEVVRALAEEVGNLDDIGRVTLPAQVFAGGVQTVLQRRLARLDDDSKQLLRYAALMGRELQLDVLASVMPEHDLDAWLSACISAAVLEVDDEVYQFAHDKLRIGLFEMIDAGQRRQMHQVVAKSLEVLYVDDVTRVNALAYHWGRAGNSHKEEHYVTLAGEQSLKNGAYDEAIAHFSQARALVEQLDMNQQRKNRKFVHLSQRSGEAHLGFADYDSARALYQESLILCQSLDDKVAVAVSLGHLGNVDFATEQFEVARVRYEEALALYREMNNQAGIARTLSRLGDVAYELGEQDRAKELYQESLHISREIGEDWGIAGASRTQNNPHASTGTSIDNLLALLRVARQQADDNSILNILMRLSRAYIKDNNYSSAVALLAAILHFEETPEKMIDDAEPILFSLQEKLDQAMIDQAWERGKSSTLSVVLAQLLD